MKCCSVMTAPVVYVTVGLYVCDETTKYYSLNNMGLRGP